MCQFYLGTHRPHWLKCLTRALFVSRRTLIRVKNLSAATCDWALDSGGFSELSMFGEWRTEPAKYADEVQMYHTQIGRLKFAAIQDWMCEPFILKKTNQTLEYHQQKTVESLLYLRERAPNMPWLPVIQGWKINDYIAHVRLYEKNGVILAAFPVVGVGSVCRRQATNEALEIFRELHSMRIHLHGFGLKLDGLKLSAQFLKSSDSMAWSFNARKNPPLSECTHRNCANCRVFAERWADRVEKVIIEKDKQQWLF